jgi:Protein of unknown function (DUF4232)
MGPAQKGYNGDMSYDDDLPPSEPTRVMPAVPGGGAAVPPALPPSPPGPSFPDGMGGGVPPDHDPTRTPKIIAGVSAALLVLFAIIFLATRGGDDEVATFDSTLPFTIATSSLPTTTLPATTLPATTAPPTTAPATIATTAPTTVAPTTTAAPTTTTAAPTTTLAPTTTVAPTTTAAPTTTTSTTTLPPTPLCTTDSLSLTIGDSEGAAGSTYTSVYVANTGTATCVLDAPGIMRFTAGGAPVGAQLRASSTSDLELAPGGVATALWRMSQTELFDCTPSAATRIEVVFGAAVVPGPAYGPVCATPAEQQGTLQGFTGGLSDLVPPGE